jgi:hypothetical protein
MPCSLVGLKVHQRFEGTYYLHLQGRGVTQARSKQHTYSSTLKIEVVRFAEMLVNWSMWRHITKKYTHKCAKSGS